MLVVAPVKVTVEAVQRQQQPTIKVARVPTGFPAANEWHVVRVKPVRALYKALIFEGGPRVVGLVGRRGSGKTT